MKKLLSNHKWKNYILTVLFTILLIWILDSFNGLMCIDRSSETELYGNTYDVLLAISDVEPQLTQKSFQRLLDTLLNDTMFQYWKENNVAYKVIIMEVDRRETVFKWIYSGADGCFDTKDDYEKLYTITSFANEKNISYTNVVLIMPSFSSGQINP